MRGPDERLEERRREDLEGVARRQHDARDAVWMVHGHELAKAAAGVVADEGDLAQVQRLEKVGDQPRDARGRAVGLRLERHRVHAERQLGHDHPEFALQVGDHRAPEIAADQQAVQEHDGLPPVPVSR